jgi:hypothetical protein
VGKEVNEDQSRLASLVASRHVVPILAARLNGDLEGGVRLLSGATAELVALGVSDRHSYPLMLAAMSDFATQLLVDVASHHDCEPIDILRMIALERASYGY